MLQCLVGAGIPCSYVYINAVSYIMKEVSSCNVNQLMTMYTL